MKKLSKIMVQLTLLMGIAFVVSACEAQEKNVAYRYEDKEDGSVTETIIEAKGDKITSMKEKVTITYTEEILAEYSKEEYKEIMEEYLVETYADLKGAEAGITKYEGDQFVFFINTDFTKADVNTYAFYTEEPFTEKDLKLGLSFELTTEGLEEKGYIKQ